MKLILQRGGGKMHLNYTRKKMIPLSNQDFSLVTT
jgi:hypothetical protein